ncbi:MULTISPECIES: MFS transporter [unclassified Mycobacterium]|uniref:MFS transporter n=1 Tax=unclassified Mycobacterium TaxID=2642494 RepID=UPI0029C671F2|nr:MULTISPECIES: MFS transporter [unclassified Mycobacterium]
MTADRLPWGILFPAVLAPNLFYATGRGAVIPVIPLVAISMGASYATAAFVAALLTIGELSTTLLASWLVVRIGERNAMMVGAIVSSAGALCSLLAPDVLLLGIGVFLIGSASSVYLVARQAWVAVTVAARQRGRAYSLVAGSQRIGTLIGPFLTALVLSLSDHPRWAFAITIGTAVFVVAILLVWPTPPEPHLANHATHTDEAMPGVLQTMWQQRRVLLRLGVAAALLASMRAVRQILVPLWGTDLGLDAVQVTLVVGVCSAIDVALFYTGGQITDRFGRMWVSVPTMIGFAAANIGLAISSLLPGQVAVYMAMAALMALSNAISSGVNATMGADLADPRQPAVFLGSWRLVGEIGSAGVPLLFAGITAVMSLPVAALAMGLLGLGGAAAMWRYIPRFLPRELR